MNTLFEEYLGYVKCDICGDGNIVMRVEQSDDGRFTLSYLSHCFNDPKWEELSRDELTAKIHEVNFMIHTRRARLHVRRFLTQLRRGKYTIKPAAKTEPSYAGRETYRNLVSQVQAYATVANAANATALAVGDMTHRMTQASNHIWTWTAIDPADTIEAHVAEPAAEAPIRAIDITPYIVPTDDPRGWFVS